MSSLLVSLVSGGPALITEDMVMLELASGLENPEIWRLVCVLDGSWCADRKDTCRSFGIALDKVDRLCTFPKSNYVSLDRRLK